MDPRLAVLDRTPPPPPLDLVTDLLDTWFGRTDDGVGKEGLRTHRRPRRLVPGARDVEVADDAVGPDDLDLARSVRAGLRTVLARAPPIRDCPWTRTRCERSFDAATGLRLRVRADPSRLESDEPTGRPAPAGRGRRRPARGRRAHLGAPQGLPRPTVPHGVLRRLPQRFGCLVLDGRLRRRGQATRLRRAAACTAGGGARRRRRPEGEVAGIRAKGTIGRLDRRFFPFADLVVGVLADQARGCRGSGLGSNT